MVLGPAPEYAAQMQQASNADVVGDVRVVHATLTVRGA
jgi:hypothetical protein